MSRMIPTIIPKVIKTTKKTAARIYYLTMITKLLLLYFGYNYK